MKNEEYYSRIGKETIGAALISWSEPLFLLQLTEHV